MDTITINLNILKELKLNINEYLTLYFIYLRDKQATKIPYESSLENQADLMVRKLLMLSKDDKAYKLTKNGLAIFESNKFFDIFYKVFPRTVPSNGGERVVSTNDPFGISAALTQKLWNKQTKGDEKLQQHIIQCLKLELSSRQGQGTLQYLHNINTWLRQGDWEKYEYLMDKKSLNNITKI